VRGPKTLSVTRGLCGGLVAKMGATLDRGCRSDFAYGGGFAFERVRGVGNASDVVARIKPWCSVGGRSEAMPSFYGVIRNESQPSSPLIGHIPHRRTAVPIPW
jgi:hypothetical protein